MIVIAMSASRWFNARSNGPLTTQAASMLHKGDLIHYLRYSRMGQLRGEAVFRIESLRKARETGLVISAGCRLASIDCEDERAPENPRYEDAPGCQRYHLCGCAVGACEVRYKGQEIPEHTEAWRRITWEQLCELKENWEGAKRGNDKKAPASSSSSSDRSGPPRKQRPKAKVQILPPQLRPSEDTNRDALQAQVKPPEVDDLRVTVESKTNMRRQERLRNEEIAKFIARWNLQPLRTKHLLHNNELSFPKDFSTTKRCMRKL